MIGPFLGSIILMFSAIFVTSVEAIVPVAEGKATPAAVTGFRDVWERKSRSTSFLI